MKKKIQHKPEKNKRTTYKTHLYHNTNVLGATPFRVDMHGQHGDMLGTGARVLQYCTAPSPISRDARFSRELHRLNTTHTVLLDYPIGSIDDQDMSNIITVTYDTVAQPRSTLLVRVNNYGDNTFTNGDMLNIKLCWPATMPYDLSIDHVYMHSNEYIANVILF